MLTTDSPLPFPDSGIVLMSIQGEASPDSNFRDQDSGFYLTLIPNQLSGFELPLILNDDKRRLHETAPSR